MALKLFSGATKKGSGSLSAGPKLTVVDCLAERNKMVGGSGPYAFSLLICFLHSPLFLCHVCFDCVCVCVCVCFFCINSMQIKYQPRQVYWQRTCLMQWFFRPMFPQVFLSHGDHVKVMECLQQKLRPTTVEAMPKLEQEAKSDLKSLSSCKALSPALWILRTCVHIECGYLWHVWSVWYVWYLWNVWYVWCVCMTCICMICVICICMICICLICIRGETILNFG